MAVNAALIFRYVFYYFSVVIWGARGVFNLLYTAVTLRKNLFKNTDYSDLPSCAKDPSLGTHDHLVVSSGSTKLKLKYVANGESGKPLMLCVHGFPECWYSWRHQLKEFSRDYHVVAIDLPGYGGSDKPADPSRYKVNALVDLLADVIAELGYEQATVVAHDWGGVIVWQFATKYGHMCKKVVIMNCPNAVGFMKGFSFKQYCCSWYMFFFQLPWLPELFLSGCDYAFFKQCFQGQWGVRNKESITDEDVKVYIHSLRTWEARSRAIDYYRVNNMLSRPARVADEKKAVLNCPVLLIWGTEDTALTLPLAAKSASMSELITVEYVEGASHWVQQDNPQQVNKLMWNFLK